MRPEFERGAGTGQWHGGPLAAIIDTVGDYALIMALRRGLPTINFRVDYLRPAIKTGADHHRHGAPRRQERGRRRCRRVQRPEGAARGRPRDLFDAAGLDRHTVRSLLHRSGESGTDGGAHDEQGFPSRVRRRRAGRPAWSARRRRRSPRRAQARRHAGRDLGRRRAAGLLRAGRRRLDARPSPRPSCSSGWATARMDGEFEGELAESLEARRRLQVLHHQDPQGREVPRRQGR